jgi:hypothetical protein
MALTRSQSSSSARNAVQKSARAVGGNAPARKPALMSSVTQCRDKARAITADLTAMFRAVSKMSDAEVFRSNIVQKVRYYQTAIRAIFYENDGFHDPIMGAERPWSRNIWAAQKMTHQIAMWMQTISDISLFQHVDYNAKMPGDVRRDCKRALEITRQAGLILQ